MSYLSQAAGTAHDVTVELRVASGAYAVTLSSAAGAAYPLVGLTSIGAQLNPLSTRRTLAGVEVTLANTVEVQRLMAPGYLVQVFLFEEATQAQTVLKVRKGEGAKLTAALGAVPFDLHVGAETVTVNAIAAAADHDALTVVRGVGVGDFRTDQVGHPAGTPCGRSPQSWVGRIVSEVLRYPNGDERLVAVYAGDGIPSYRDGAWTIPMQDGLGYFNRPIGRGIGPAKVANGGDYGDPGLNRRGLLVAGERFAALDPNLNFQLVPPVFVVGETIINAHQRRNNAIGLQVANPNGLEPAFFFPAQGQHGAISRDRAGRPARLPQIGEELEPRLILRNRADLVVLTLLNSATGDGSNGTWDTLPGNAKAQIGLGIQTHRINDLEIARLLGHLDDFQIAVEPGELLLDALERELSLLGLFLDLDTAGLMTLREINYAINAQSCDHQLTDASLHAQASEELRVGGRIVNRLKLKAGYDFIEEKHRAEVNMPGSQTAENDFGEAHEFAPTWMSPPTTVEELEQLEEDLGQILARWNVPRPAFAVEHDWTQHLVRVGDSAAVVNARLPNGSGGQGINAACLVTAVEADLEAGLVRITAEVVGSGAGGYVCPAGEVLAVVFVGGGVYDLTLRAHAASHFTIGLRAGGGDADENEHFAAGWAVRGYGAADGLTVWTGEVVAVSAAQVLRVSATLPPSVGEIVTPRAYGAFGSAPAAQPPLDALPGNTRPGLLPPGGDIAYLWLADGANLLGGADPGREWI